MSLIAKPGFDHVEDSNCANSSLLYSSATLPALETTEPPSSMEAPGETLSFPSGLIKEASELDVTMDIEAPGSEEASLVKEPSQDCSSVFLETECGEPLTPQHLRIDFTPEPAVDDTDFLLQKCADFWKLVEGSKKLQELKALPEKMEKEEVVSEKSCHPVVSERGDHLLANHEAIHVIERKGRMVDDCFMNRMKTRYCEAGSGDYFADSPQLKPGAIPNWQSGRRGSVARSQREDAAKLCSELHQWDLHHHKSMEPPNHGPPHTYAMLHRN